MKEVTPKEAASLLAATPGAVFVDVRSCQEFVAGHPEGAVNVPVAEPNQWGQMEPNPEFLQVLTALVPDPATTVFFSCKSGQRSQYACELAETAGFVNTINVDGGFGGRPNPYEPVIGWRASGLPVSTANGDGVSYESLRQRALG